MSKRREEREQLTTETCSIGDDDARVTKEGVRPCLIITAFLSVAIVLALLVAGVATVASAVQPPTPTAAAAAVVAAAASSTWSSTPSTIDGGTWQVRAVTPPGGGAPLTWAAAIDALADGTLGPYLDALLVGSPHVGSAFFWETPPLTAATAATTAFEFVTVPGSLDGTADPGPFSSHFAACPAGDGPVISFANLGGDATLVVPCAASGVPEATYAHFAAFTRGAPKAQRLALWRQLGGAIRELLPTRGDAPTWVSTAGGGVAWLHVRLDSAPKYYTHRPYTRFAGGGARSLRAAAFAGSGGRQDEGAWRKGTSLR